MGDLLPETVLPDRDFSPPAFHQLETGALTRLHNQAPLASSGKHK
jgi:hypothetical protein